MFDNSTEAFWSPFDGIWSVKTETEAGDGERVGIIG